MRDKSIRRFLHVYETAFGSWDGVRVESSETLYCVEGVWGDGGFPRMLTAREVLDGMTWRGGAVM